MSPVRGREGREQSRAKEIAAGKVPQLNARRRQSKARQAEREAAALEAEGLLTAVTVPDPDDDWSEELPPEDLPDPTPSEGDEAAGFTIGTADEGTRLDLFLAARLEGISRSRVQLLIEQEKVALTSVTGLTLKVRASHPLQPGEHITILGHAKPKPLRAVAEDIPLEVLYEDDDLAVINKPAGMMVHAGAGNEPEDERGKGTLVNALLFHMASLSQSPKKSKPEDIDDAGAPGLSAAADETRVPTGPDEAEHDLRPGIVHRLDKLTSGVLVIAKNDQAHAKLSKAFADRLTTKHYIALVQGEMEKNSGTVNAPISRDVNRRTRMTTRRADGRSAVTHWKVRERLDTPWGKYTLLDVTIETGRTHQIRVHLSSIGHPVVGDTLYGAATEMKPAVRNPLTRNRPAPLQLGRNFLHAQTLGLPHPRTGEQVQWSAPLPPELEDLLASLRGVKLK
jgi:23S rRNA pseudouridine1911/1915/1917 synthase